MELSVEVIKVTSSKEIKIECYHHEPLVILTTDGKPRWMQFGEYDVDRSAGYLLNLAITDPVYFNSVVEAVKDSIKEKGE